MKRMITRVKQSARSRPKQKLPRDFRWYPEASVDWLKLTSVYSGGSVKTPLLGWVGAWTCNGRKKLIG